MNRTTILELLNQHRDEVQRRFGTKRLALFGSAARDELRDDSDVDILVEFSGPATFDGYMDLKFFLEELLGRSVDLVTKDAVKPRMRLIIERDLIDVA
ncbi:MAG: DNA polymerase subunit beta [Betaproteobacteria bacterium RIFCSPLOWO2_02_FULL_65_24]|nr:MAG: DNA polymerase subunit beta [Betaproteobacteria bacterium RIFCSPLOWO2_02_FULL_65_24]